MLIGCCTQMPGIETSIPSMCYTRIHQEALNTQEAISQQDTYEALWKSCSIQTQSLEAIPTHGGHGSMLCHRDITVFLARTHYITKINIAFSNSNVPPKQHIVNIRACMRCVQLDMPMKTRIMTDTAAGHWEAKYKSTCTSESYPECHSGENTRVFTKV